jgi:RNA methyltransferase, TrmH family
MIHEEPIRSRANPVFKTMGGILAGKDRQSILLEGERLIEDAIGARRSVGPVYLSTERRELARKFVELGQSVFMVDAKLFRELSALKNSPGVVTICKMPENRRLDTLKLGPHSLVLVAHGISDPGNLGALARSAEAFGASALVLTKGSTQPFSDKALRGSMGSLLRLPVSHGWEPEELVALLSGLHCRHACAATRKGQDPRAFDWTGPIALWLGAETGALPDAAKKFAKLTIPIQAQVESLNVTVAASLLLYESARARHG